MIKEIKPGEIIYGNCKIQYKHKNKIHIVDLQNQIISRKYESKFPEIENSDLIISKIPKIKKKRIEISEMKYIEIEIIARTGFIMKYDKNTKHSTGKIEKTNKIGKWNICIRK